MKHVLKRVLLLFTIVTIVSSLLGFTFVGKAFALSTKAATWPQCHYNDATCSGQDSDHTLGPDGKAFCDSGAKQWKSTNLVDSNGAAYGVVLLYGSAYCGTNWSVTVASNGCDYPYSWCTKYIMNANITRSSDGRHYDGTWYDYSVVYSPMVFAPTTPAQACGSINNMPGACTAWF